MQASAELALKDPETAAELLLDTACKLQAVVDRLEDAEVQAAAAPHGRITQLHWRAMAAAVCWNGTYLHPFGDRGAVLSYRRNDCHNPEKRGPRDPAPGENQYSNAYVLHDNGGEINISGLNFRLALPSIPVNPPGLSANPTLLCGPETMAYRISMTLEGQVVDYDFDADAELKGA